MKQELTGQLIEYDQCRRMASPVCGSGERHTVFVRTPAGMGQHHMISSIRCQVTAGRLAGPEVGRTTVRKVPTQQQFEPLVSAPQVSVSSRVVYILHGIAGGAKRWTSCFPTAARPGGQRGHLSGTAGAGARRPCDACSPGRAERCAGAASTAQRSNESETNSCRSGSNALCLRGAHIGADKLAQALQLPTASVESALEALHERCQKEDSGLCLLHLNTHWQLATKTEFAECVRRVLDTRRSIPLGPAAMETPLTVIAHNQPVSPRLH